MIAPGSYRLENLGRRDSRTIASRSPSPRNSGPPPPKMGVLRENHSRNKLPLKHDESEKNGIKEAPRGDGFCPIASTFDIDLPGWALGQIDKSTIVLERSCTAEGQQRCLFDALPAGAAPPRGLFLRKTQKENFGSGTGIQFPHHTSGPSTIRFPPLPPAPRGHLHRNPVDPEH